MRIAVVGSGISGLGAAWLLSQHHDVTLFEGESRLGGHSNTVQVAWPEGGSGPVDTGFIVYNTASYPNLIALFDHLGVPTAPTRMSFSVSLRGGDYEYSGTGPQGLFGQPSNLLLPGHWRMAKDILRFFREAPGIIASGRPAQSLGDWLAERRYSPEFIDNHILPMGAAIWSTPSRDILGFPAQAFARFFANHGLLQVRNRPEWRTVRGGSRVYVMRLVERFRGRIVTADRVTALTRSGSEVTVARASGAVDRFDRCLVATHADQALAILADSDEDERHLLGAFRYARNQAVLHRDARLMPRRRRLWSSWNYLGGGDGSLSVSYWMNRLQPLSAASDHFVTLNPALEIDPSLVSGQFEYDHPMYDAKAISAQAELWSLQGRRGTWFAGSYFGWGFHEDGLQSGLAAAEELGGLRRPWRVDGMADRISVRPVSSPDGEARAAA